MKSKTTKTLSPIALSNELMPIELFCSYDDLNKSLVMSHIEHLTKDQKNLGNEALPMITRLTAVSVVTVHSDIHGNGICYRLVEWVLRIVATTLDELWPAYIERVQADVFRFDYRPMGCDLDSGGAEGYHFGG